MKKRVLLMYISENSGHHHAGRAIESAFHELSDDIDSSCVDSFHYTNPILEKLVNQAYMSVIKRKPEFWGRIYDNPNIVRKTQKLRDSIHRYNSNKIKVLMDEFKPDAVLCTQAFPCGIIADYKKTWKSNIFLGGVLTDYAPHSYWMYENVDAYFVPSEEAKERLITNGILEERIHTTGIPIDPKFRKISDKDKILESLGLSGKKPIVLVMGGSQGIGPIQEIMRVLSLSTMDFQVIAVAGSNKKLLRYLSKISVKFPKKLVNLGYCDNVDELMEVSSVVISKPGGITISEAMAKGLPVIIVKPIPGQEEMNANHLVKYQVGMRVDNLNDIDVFLREIFRDPSILVNMKKRAREFSKPESALNIARFVLERIM